MEILEEEYYAKIDNDPKYDIVVDPTDKYKMSDTQKEFIANYVQFKNVPLAAKLTNIDEDTAMDYYNQYSTKMEIRRINLALYHRAFASKMLGLDEIGGYLTSLLIGENMAESDKIGTRDKLQVVKLMLEINKMKQETAIGANNIIDYDIQDQLNDLSVDAIKQLINSSKKKKSDDGEEGKETVSDNFSKVYSDNSVDEIMQKKVAKELMGMANKSESDNELNNKISKFMQSSNEEEERILKQEETFLEEELKAETEEEEEEEQYDD